MSDNPDNFDDSYIFKGENTILAKKITIMDKMRRKFPIEISDEIPAFVVIGDQSSGKTSVLEHISGINLPRKNGMCTKIPCILTMERRMVDKKFAYFNNDETKEI